ncbi:MAG: endonuclease/exonuclease/phosphatase family protein [Clostridia bacterium]|nr:endonuclease/exonuclease/phosphatase family protein [Clostridia bacterium]
MKRIFIIFSVFLLILSMTLVSCEKGNTETTTDAATEAPVPEQTTAEETTAEVTTEAPETTKEETQMPKTLRIGSYNIKHAAEANLNLNTIAQVIKKANLDIVGLQEIDYKTTRSNRVDQPAKLAEYTEMPYYVFVRGIDYQGGQYGTLILSKYPIVSSEVIPLESWDKEGRSLGHAVIDVDGRQIDFFNTHLSYEDTSLRGLQFFEISEKTDLCKDFILTGDFNTANFSEFTILGGNLINDTFRKYPTFPGGNSAIDNIVYSDSFKEIASGTVTQSYSDHYMLWAEFELN